MFKKLLLAIVFFCSLPLNFALANNVMMGKMEDGTVVFLDTDIKPVAYVDKDGARVMADGMFTGNYLLYKSGGGAMSAVNNIFDAKTKRTFERAFEADGWQNYKEGGDGFLFGAYVVRDYVKIMSSRPFMLNNNFLPRTRAPLWPVDNNGWQKVYERKDGSRAWVQTKSAVLSHAEDGRLPHVRVLVRRLESAGGKSEISFSYESYNPEQRTKQVLRSWDKNRQELPVEAKTVHNVPILSKDAAIASIGYVVFMLDYEQTKRRVPFAVGEEALFIRDSWFAF